MSNSSSTRTSRTTVKTPLAPAAIGPYSQGVLVNGTLYVSGQIAIDPETGSMISGSVEEETKRVLITSAPSFKLPAWISRTWCAAKSS